VKELALAPSRVVLATHNERKVDELCNLLQSLPVEFVSLSVVAPDAPAAVEDGVTLEENVKHKALFYANLLGEPCLADEFSITVDGEVMTDQTESALVDELTAAHTDRVEAVYTCALTLAYPNDGWPLTVTGTLDGEVRVDSHGDDGYVYDGHFWLASGHTLADASETERARLSPRRRAANHLRDAVMRRWAVPVGQVTVYPVSD